MDKPQVALVTGASRGAGAGIARGLGAHGMTVYVTGRTITPGDAKAWDGSVLPGTVSETAQAVTDAGGKGVPVVCDHDDDEAVANLFKQIESEAGRLDILVNNAAYMHPQLIEKKPFWEKELAAVGIIDVGLRSAYVASWHAAKMMAKQGSGTIAMGSSFGATCYMHGPAYGAQKAGLDKFAHDMAHDFQGTGVRVFSIWMGMLRTERAAVAAKTEPEQYEQMMQMAENPEFTGHIVWELATQDLGKELTGKTLIGAEVAQQLGIKDEGEDRPSHRGMLGDPHEFSEAAVY